MSKDNLFDDFDRDFDKMQRQINRRVGFAAIFGFLWMLFLMGCLGFWTFMVGRWTGVW